MTKGERIKLLRNKLGLNQIELAEMIAVSKQTLYKYENDIITNIPSDKMELIAEALNTTPAFLMGWEEKKSFLDGVALANLAKKYRQLTDEEKLSVDKYIDFLLSSRK